MKRERASTKTVLIVLCLGIALTACAVPKAAREGAGLLSAYTIQVQKEVKDFAKSRGELAKARLRNMSLLENNAIETELRINGELAIWDTKDIDTEKKDIRVLLYNATRNATGKAAQQHITFVRLREMQNKSVAEMKTAVNVSLEKLGNVAKALADLSKEPDFESQAEFLVDFFTQVRASIKDLKEDAKKEAKKGTDKTKKKGKEIDLKLNVK